MRVRSTIRDVTGLAPATVTSVASGDLPDYRPPRGRAPSPPGQPGSPARLLCQVPAAALSAALELAGGDPSRLYLDLDGSVLVANDARPGTDASRQR